MTPVQRPDPPREALRSRGLPRGLMFVVALVALASLVMEYGFRLGSRTDAWLERVDYALAACFGLDLLLVFARSTQGLKTLRTRWHEFALMLVFGLGVLSVALFGTEENLASFLGFVHLQSVAKLLLALVQVFLLVNLVVRALAAQERLLESRLPSEYLLVGSFAALILIGTLLLWLPGSMAEGRGPISLLDAFFTATSASCVTGLTVVDTGTDVSTLGQVILMVLFQVGGLGVITFVAFGSFLATKRFTVPQTVALRDLTKSSTLVDARRFVWQVVLWTFLLEGAGAAILYFGRSLGDASKLEHLFDSGFHAVSAFCNAGFGLESDSFESLQSALWPNVAVMSLILIGGLGMPVTRELLEHRIAHLPVVGRWRVLRRIRGDRKRKRLSVQCQLSLWMTAGLVMIGFVGFWALESNGVLSHLDASDSALASAFQSVTTRTAGFNSVPMDRLSDATLVLMTGLMAIGAGPISTGGGIKTVTFAVLLLGVRAMISGRPVVEVMGRTIPRLIIRGALSVFVIYVLSAGLMVFVLSISDPSVALRDRIFLSVSALSTVGLSTTPVHLLSPVGKLTLCAAMFVGRVGPLALVLSVFRTRGTSEDYQYPEEDLVVG